MGHPGRKTGKTFTCKQCGNAFYRTPGQIRLGAVVTCSKACLSFYKRGPNATFWGRRHSDATRQRISESRTGKGLKNQHAKGYKHTDAARARIAEASKRMWLEHRDKMIDSLPRGTFHPAYKPYGERKYQELKFSETQRREWIDTMCAYCGSKEYLELDHIVPLFDGGTNIKENSQTLCRGCNIWKIRNVDLPRFTAAKAIQGDQINPASPRQNSS